VKCIFCKLQKGCTRLAAASDKAYQLLVQGRWFFPGTPAFSTAKTRHRHDIAEILLKMALKHPKINQSIFMHFNEAPFVKVKQYINAITKMELNIYLSVYTKNSMWNRLWV
jgi:hypothetical protein